MFQVVRTYSLEFNGLRALGPSHCGPASGDDICARCLCFGHVGFLFDPVADLLNLGRQILQVRGLEVVPRGHRVWHMVRQQFDLVQVNATACHANGRERPPQVMRRDVRSDHVGKPLHGVARVADVAALAPGGEHVGAAIDALARG